MQADVDEAVVPVDPRGALAGALERLEEEDLAATFQLSRAAHDLAHGGRLDLCTCQPGVGASSIKRSSGWARVGWLSRTKSSRSLSPATKYMGVKLTCRVATSPAFTDLARNARLLRRAADCDNRSVPWKLVSSKGIKAGTAPTKWPRIDELAASALVSLEVDNETWWVALAPEGFCVGDAEAVFCVGATGGGVSFYPADTRGGGSQSPWTAYVMGGLLPEGVARVSIGEGNDVLAVARCEAGAWLVAVPWGGREMDLQVRSYNADDRLVGDDYEYVPEAPRP